MTVAELIEKLQKLGIENQNAKVFMGYDGDIVVTESKDVEFIESETQIGACWYSVKPGAVVILSTD